MKYIRTDKIFYHPERINDWLKHKMVMPITMELHLTNKCNMRCGYCFFDDRHNTDTLSIEYAKKIIYDFMRMGVKGIIFSGGGEPTLHKDFKGIVKYAYSSGGLDVGLITNGIVYPDVLEYLTWVRFSLDSCYPETFKRIKKVDKFTQVTENIIRCIEEKRNVTIGVQMVVTEENYDQIFDMFDYANKVKADYFQFRPIENIQYSNNVWHEINRARDYFNNSSAGLQVITTENKWIEITSNTAKQYKDCPGADLIGAVDARGDFYICCHHVQDKTAKYGNMIVDDIGKILGNRKKVQDLFDYSKCPVACRASTINQALESFSKLEHINFL